MALGNFNYTTRNINTPYAAQVHAAAVGAQGTAAAARHQAAGNAAAARASSQGGIVESENQARGLIGGSQAEAAGNAAQGYYGGLGNAFAGMYGGMGTAEAGRFGALGGLATAMAQDNANRYGAYAAAEGNRQTAMANEAAARYGAYGMAEVARQTAFGNLGSAALGAYGSTANQALQAWSQNQQAYNNALAQMQGSSQSAMSGLGQSRNAALGQLGSAYSSAGTGLGAASAVGDLSASFGGNSGGGFNAYDPTGTVASGNPGGGGFYGNVNRSSSSSTTPGMAGATFGGLASVGQNLMAQDISGALQDNASRGLDSLSDQHYSSRMMPSQMQRQTFADMLMMGDQYIAPTMAGMNQFYANANYNRPDFASGMNQFYGAMDSFRPDYSSVLEPLTRQSTFAKPSFGSSPTLGGMFGNEAVGASTLAKLTPFTYLQTGAGQAANRAEANQINEAERARQKAVQDAAKAERDRQRAKRTPRQEALSRAMAGVGGNMNPNVLFPGYQSDVSRRPAENSPAYWREVERVMNIYLNSQQSREQNMARLLGQSR
jgi:hypothetical protein